MEDLNSFTRRDFLRGFGALSAAGLTLWAGGCESCKRQIQQRPTRRNIANLPANDPIIQAYKDAVTAMKALPASDGRNWTKQAEIHQNHCVHSNWWFLPWHRAYLFYFERICRQLSGYNDFALPYWNWTSSPSIPAPFWGAGNPLLNTTRTASQASVANSSMVGSATINNILNQTNFFLFASDQATTQQEFAGYGMLEGTPHNYIHGFVGGDMGAYMSPLDPIFWCHHNMIDCLWVDWNINRGNPNTNDPAWANFQFTDFVDETGTPVTVQAITTVLYPIFSYQFEACGPTSLTAKISDRAQLEKFLREGAPAKLEFVKRFELREALTAELQKPASGSIKVEPEAFRTVLESGGKDKAVLTVDEVEVPEKQDVFVRVFINKPDASSQTSLDDPHYAGSFAFFCCPSEESMKGHEGMAATGRPKAGYLVDLTPTLQKLNQGGSLSGGQLDVTLVPVPFEERTPTTQRLTIGRLEVGVARF
jgi:tyrosinase